MEGYDDIRPGYTKVADWSHDAELEDYEIETLEYGMDFEEADLEVDDVAADSATITEAVLAGERDDYFADAITLNAAFRIYAGGDAGSLDDGLDRARSALADGSAQSVLEELRSFSA
jgi:anthranilate phosphoribosyltransferase